MINVELAAAISGHQNPIYTVENSQKLHIFFTAGNDKGVVEWSLKTHDFVKVMMPVQSSVYALHCPKAAPLMAVGERRGKISLFHFVDQQVVAELKLHEQAIFDMQSLNSKKELLAASEDGSVSVWSLENYQQLYQFKVAKAMVRCMAISPSEEFLAFGCKDHEIYIYRSADFSLVQKLSGHTLPVTALRFSPDGKYLLSGSRDAQLKIWNTEDFSLKDSIPAHLFAIYDIQYHPKGKIFATASRDKSIKIWDAEEFRLLKTISTEKGYPAHRLSVNKLAWSKFNEQLISVGDDKMVLVWDILSEE
ncbi:MAG: WD40 repeat domain-containing protein [Sphingobacteriaceae bacterium]